MYVLIVISYNNFIYLYHCILHDGTGICHIVHMPCQINYFILFSLAMREDRYFIAGRAIAVSLVHGGPPASFLSPTLFSSLVDGPELAKPVLEDVADGDLREKIIRVIFLEF